MAKNLMGIREYARHRNVSQTAISKAVKDGRIAATVSIIKGNKKIDVAKADEILNKTDTDSNKDLKAAKGLANAKVVKETFAAKIAQLNYEQKAGKLCRVDDVQRAAADTARVTRNSLLTIPDRIAPIIASEKDIKKISKLITTEINASLENLSQIDWEEILDRGKE